MHNPWVVLTARGKGFFLLGLGIAGASLIAGQRDVMRLGLLLLLLPFIAAILVGRARLRMSCERSVEPAEVALGSSMTGRILLGQEGRLPAAVLLLEDTVPRELGNRPRFVVDKADLFWRREISYPMHGKERGRFLTGPLLVRTADPFGLVRLDRQFSATSEVLVTPEICPLMPLRSVGGGGSAGEVRPMKIGASGQDDVLIREYRHGDDVRRIHWRSTAHRGGELMVRREEQTWDPSASIIVDSRVSAHAGHGVQNSFEWSVSAAASIACHFIGDGFGIHMYDADGRLSSPGLPTDHASLDRESVIRRLTDIQLRPTNTLHYGLEAATGEQGGQLVIAIMGTMSPADAEALVRVRRHRSQGMALVLAVDSFDQPWRGKPPAGHSSSASHNGEMNAGHQVAVQILRDDQWRVVEVSRGLSVADAWAGLERSQVPV